ncbi:MAG: pimeloyl-CoA dehydrogenase large subunit [Steroidobacteraceae bacterium]|nr:pimeloyl-CoA dehydrogenase large subunit [Steroidobacteraceae bacterium]
MDLNYSAADLQWRDEVRRFLDASLPADTRGRLLEGLPAGVEDIRRWQRTLYAHGWGAVAWPERFGGLGLSKVRQHLFELECATAGAPPQLPFGLKMLGPVLMQFGNPTQQQYFLPRILSGEHWWCQGYSEPGAGSDLASLKTRAVLDGEHYVVNGQKAWNTLGQHADWMFCLVRTDAAAKPQRGISFLLIDMRSPGISVRPTKLLDGTPEVNEIWFENVRVPVAQRVGEENQGWTYAKFLLEHERTSIAGVGVARRAMAHLRRVAAVHSQGGRAMIEDPLFRARVAQLDIELTALEITNLRMISQEASKTAPTPDASILKIRGSQIQQAISELLLETIGIRALPFAELPAQAPASPALPGPVHAAGLTANYLNLRKLSIFGGSNEIQKNIIAHMLLDS